MLVLTPQAAFQTGNIFPQEEAAEWIIASVLGLAVPLGRVQNDSLACVFSIR